MGVEKISETWLTNPFPSRVVCNSLIETKLKKEPN